MAIEEVVRKVLLDEQADVHSDGFVLSAHPDKSQGRPRTTSSSQLISQKGLPNRVSHNAP